MKLVCPTCGNQNLSPSPTGRGLLCKNCRRQVSRKDAQKSSTTRSKRRTTRGRSERQEKRTARQYGGKQTKNSGAMDDKGDVKVEGKLRIEDKTTKKRSYRLTLSDLRKVARAAKGDEMPVMKICFEDDLRQQFVVLPEPYFRRLLEDAEW